MERIAAVPMRWYGDGLVIIEGGNGVVEGECGEGRSDGDAGYEMVEMGLWRCSGGGMVIIDECCGQWEMME